MQLLADLYAPIRADLDRALRIFRCALRSDQPCVAELCAHVAAFHGKYLRPALLLLSARACGRVRRAHHVLAAVVEMVHIATLVHDDVLDEADTRRRAATVNRRWGTEQAVLLGDYLISHAFHLCCRLGSPYAARLIGRTTNTVCEGELMQVASRCDLDLSQRTYLEIIRRKTAALIATCCRLGAQFAGAETSRVRALTRFGRLLGVAFQIRDDVLDLVGDEDVAGKSLGRDMQKGKLTLPLIHYLRRAAPDARQELCALLARGDAAARAQLVERLRAAGSLDYAARLAERYVRTATGLLAGLPPSEARQSLSAMAEFILARGY